MNQKKTIYKVVHNWVLPPEDGDSGTDVIIEESFFSKNEAIEYVKKKSADPYVRYVSLPIPR